jgi:hypothetical protein
MKILRFIILTTLLIQVIVSFDQFTLESEDGTKTYDFGDYKGIFISINKGPFIECKVVIEHVKGKDHTFTFNNSEGVTIVSFVTSEPAIIIQILTVCDEKKIPITYLTEKIMQNTPIRRK